MKAKRLAQALNTMTVNASKAEGLRLYEQFSAYLKARGMTSLLPRILREYTRLTLKNTKPATVVTLARKADGKTTVSKILTSHNIDTEAETRIDETIIGGYQIKTESRLIDASHKSALLAIYHRITT